MNKCRCFAVVLVIAFCLPAWANTNAPVAKLLPGPKDAGLSQWKAVPDAVQYGKGDGLTDIYNGGYEEYIKAGVVDAVRNLYVRGQDYMEVTVHTMKTARAAQDFFVRETRAADPKKVEKTVKGTMVIVSARGESRGYAFSGKYYITAFPMYSGKKAGPDSKTFLKAVMTKASPQKQPAKK